MNARSKKTRVEKAVRVEARRAKALSHEIHGYAERPFREVESSKTLAAYLEDRGFKVEFNLKNIPTAFRATWGSGKPAIGMLGEYDSLPNCGGDEGTWGHG